MNHSSPLRLAAPRGSKADAWWMGADLEIEMLFMTQLSLKTQLFTRLHRDQAFLKSLLSTIAPVLALQ